MSALRRRNALSVWSMNFGPSMTPMVDVVLVILIFFMASASLAGPEWFLKAALPTGEGREAASEPDPFDMPPARFPVVLRVGGDGVTRVSGFGVDDATVGAFVSRMTEVVSRLAPDALVVVIDAEDGVPYADVVRVHEGCAHLGIKKIGLR